jgi:hypothetical protein
LVENKETDGDQLEKVSTFTGCRLVGQKEDLHRGRASRTTDSKCSRTSGIRKYAPSSFEAPLEPPPGKLPDQE